MGHGRLYHLISSVSDMLFTLKWPSLQRCRLHSRLSMFYKFINKHALFINIPEHYNPRISAYTTRHHHPLHYAVPWLSTTYYQISYFPKTIQDWNNLPCQFIESDSLNKFSHHLQDFH